MNGSSFDLRERIKSSNSGWVLSHPAYPHQTGHQYELCVSFSDAPEFALYERCGADFIFVDCFMNYDDASGYAKKILAISSCMKQSILHTQVVLS